MFIFMSCKWASDDRLFVYLVPGAVIFGLGEGVGGIRIGYV